MKSALDTAAATLEAFRETSLREAIARIEGKCQNAAHSIFGDLLKEQKITTDTLDAALLIKWQSRQINEIVHAAGILLALPHILETGEVVESVSLGAGNTGRGFDLCTDRRIAEFTFINWQGGPEVIRQNKILKDFFFLAEAPSPKRKELYTIGTEHPLRFFESRRSLAPILKGNRKLGDAFKSTYGERFSKVREYYEHRRNEVQLRDVGAIVPQFRSRIAAAALEGEDLGE